jgi:hypothetical protein
MNLLPPSSVEECKIYFYPEDGGNKVIHNIGNDLAVCTLSHRLVGNFMMEAIFTFKG